MIEITKYVADDGTEFEDKSKCITYENNLRLISHKNDFTLFDANKYPLFLENVKSEEIFYIVVKHPCGAIALGNWFKKCDDINPFEFTEEEDCLGTWAYSNSTGWIKLEDEIQRYTSIIAELNK